MLFDKFLKQVYNDICIDDIDFNKWLKELKPYEWMNHAEHWKDYFID